MSRTLRFAAALTAALALTSCSNGDADTEASAGATDQIEVVDAWVKAGDENMTSAFGIISHSQSEPIVITSVTSDKSETVEMHEMVMGTDGTMSMQEISGGFTIEPEEELVLEPGGHHLMLVGLTDPVIAGDAVTFVVTLDDGSTFEFEAIGKEYTGANETYHDSQ